VGLEKKNHLDWIKSERIYSEEDNSILIDLLISTPDVMKKLDSLILSSEDFPA
jgi:hypothetical protein